MEWRNFTEVILNNGAGQAYLEYYKARASMLIKTYANYLSVLVKSVSPIEKARATVLISFAGFILFFVSEILTAMAFLTSKVPQQV